jgi:hypothetical protein
LALGFRRKEKFHIGVDPRPIGVKEPINQGTLVSGLADADKTLELAGKDIEKHQDNEGNACYLDLLYLEVAVAGLSKWNELV